MVRIWCDGCKKEVGRNQYNIAQITDPFDKSIKMKRHLCGVCSDRLVDFINSMSKEVEQVSSDVTEEVADKTVDKNAGESVDKPTKLSGGKRDLRAGYTPITDEDLLNSHMEEFCNNHVSNMRVSVSVRKAVVRMFNSGCTSGQILDKVDVSITTVLNLIGAWKHYCKSNIDTGLDADAQLLKDCESVDTGKVIALFNAGFLNKEIASELDVSVELIERIIDYYSQYGIIPGEEE